MALRNVLGEHSYNIVVTCPTINIITYILHSPHIFGTHPCLLQMVQTSDGLPIKLQSPLTRNEVSINGEGGVIPPLLIEVCECSFDPIAAIVWVGLDAEHASNHFFFQGLGGGGRGGGKGEGEGEGEGEGGGGGGRGEGGGGEEGGDILQIQVSASNTHNTTHPGGAISV